MDKILLTAFLSALAGFITAILSIVKLVNEKESKTTDYRQNWTDSARNELANLIGLLNAQAAHIAASKKNARQLLNIHLKDVTDGQKELKESATGHAEHSLKETQASARETRQQIYQSYARARLHFKPDDISFSRVEQHFNVIIGLFQQLDIAENFEDIAVLREKVHSTANEMTGFCRHILKTEWETVKKGERAYQLTKKWSIAGSIAMFFILISIGIHTGISMWRADIVGGQGSLSDQATDPHRATTSPMPKEKSIAIREEPVETNQVSNITIYPTISSQASATHASKRANIQRECNQVNIAH